MATKVAAATEPGSSYTGRLGCQGVRRMPAAILAQFSNVTNAWASSCRTHLHKLHDEEHLATVRRWRGAVELHHVGVAAHALRQLHLQVLIASRFEQTLLPFIAA